VKGILAFHDLDEPSSVGITNMTTHAFTQHLNHLAGRGYTYCELSHSTDGNPGSRQIAVTFDDALERQLEVALPHLLNHNIKATAFVVTSFAGRRATWDYNPGLRRHADWAQLRAWVDAGMNVGSHTCTHRDLRKLSDMELQTELVLSRQTLEDTLQTPVAEIAYPFGRSSKRVREAVARAGYKKGVTTRAVLSQDDPFQLPRVMVSNIDTPYAVDHRFRTTAWGTLERLKQNVVGVWAGGTIRYQQLRGDYRSDATKLTVSAPNNT
jgi:peptidoglycan/xylan/chitin deacetylase (PgdA/CDA1 family)